MHTSTYFAIKGDRIQARIQEFSSGGGGSNHLKNFEKQKKKKKKKRQKGERESGFSIYPTLV